MKRIMLLLALAWLLPGSVFAQCPVRLVYNPALHGNKSIIMTLNIKTNFCAAGNGVTNDDSAFDAASAFINARGGYCKLVIPAGTYIVGKQSSSTSRYRTTNDVLHLDSVRLVEVTGQGLPRLKYQGGGVLKYGYFNSNGTPKMLNSELPVQELIPPSAADLGCMIRIHISSNIKVNGLILDGNLRPGQITIGGHDIGNFNGIQEDYSGIGIWHSDTLDINNVRAERMGLDGFYIYNTREDGSNYNHKKVLIQNCTSDYNGRQGISIMGGENIAVYNSSFTNIGMGEIQFTGLQAGVDIEPEAPFHSVKNVNFKNCTFSDCRNVGIAITAGYGPVREIYFTNCTVDNISATGNSWAINLGRHKKVKFTDCQFFGHIVIENNNATSYDEGYTFKRCLFSDCSYKIIPGNPPLEVRKEMAVVGTVLIYTFSSWDYVKMDSCTFDVYNKRPWYLLNTPTGVPSAITNSYVYVNGQTGVDFSASAPQDTVMQDKGFTLTNNKFYMHSGQRYSHNGASISGANPQTATTTWNGNTFYRWTENLPAKECVDTLAVSP